MEGHTFAVYRSIIDEVLDKVRADFQAEGVDERVLQEMQMMWETKLLQTNAIAPAGVLVEEKAPQTPQNAFFATDLNYPPPPDLPVHQYEVDPSSTGDQAGTSRAGREDKPSTSAHDAAEDHDTKRRRLLEASSVGASSSLAPAAAGMVSDALAVGSDALDGWRIRGGAGPEGDEEEDYNDEEPDKPPAEAANKAEAQTPEEEEGEDDLNELDDEDELKEDEDEEAEATANIVLAQYEKVNRTKNKWKCALKEGVIKLNGRDILFNKANGEFVW